MGWHTQTATIHRASYLQGTDPTLDTPNLVQPFVHWINTSNNNWYYRNSGNTAWVLIVSLANVLTIDTDITLAANSDTRVASQKAVKAYADALIAANDAMVFKGVIDCSANPNYPAADAGHTYRASVAGKIGGASGINVEVGDFIICLADSTASGNQATVGTSWAVIQANLDGALLSTAIGVTVQAYNAKLGGIASLSVAADKISYFTGSSASATTDLTAFARTILAGADAAAVRAVLGSSPLEILQNSKSAAYTTVLADSGKHLLHPAADTTARTFTIDSNANVAYPIGTALTFINQNGAGIITIAITTDTMRLAGAGTTGSRTLAANGIATAIKITSTEWIISGTGLT